MSLREIAARLGLSVTTVSRALADYSDVADETRRRVRAEAERVGYVPNAIARRLQKGRADAIGVVASLENDGSTDTFLFEAVAAVWSRLAELDRDLILLSSRLPRERTGRRQFERTISERRIDGLVLIRPRESDWRIDYALERRMPCVALGGRHDGRPGLVGIAADEAEAARLLVERESGFGHRRLCCIAPREDYEFVSARLDALTQATASHMTMEVRVATASEPGGHDATLAALTAPEPATVLVYLINRMALGGLAAVHETPAVPGRHVSLVSYGDNPMLAHANPPMTAIRFPIREMARHAVDVLTAPLDGVAIEIDTRWPVELVGRRSDGPLI